jgi:hypothetical protein
MSGIKLSILVPAIPSRRNSTYALLMDSLMAQTSMRRDVEVLALLDTKHRTIGEKRQNLLNLAQGEYVVFVDDDDRVVDHFVRAITAKLEACPNADCVVYDMVCTLPEGPTITCKYGVEYLTGPTSDFDTHFYPPTCTMVWKRSIVMPHLFEHMNQNEDLEWGRRASASITCQERIDDVLYFYDVRTSESGIRAEAPP